MKEKIQTYFMQYMLGELIILLLSWIWYDDIRWGLPLQLLMIPYRFVCEDYRKQKRVLQYERGFYDFLQSMIPSLQAGYSLENACLCARKELLELHGENHAFVRCLSSVSHGLTMHVPLDDLFYEMSDKTENDEIYQFAVVLEILKNMGGNTVEVLKASMERIQKKMETGEEIRTLLSGKIFEKNIMLLMPFLMVFYLRITNGTYLEPIYHSLAGHILMTASLMGILACFYWTERIVRISF